MKPFNLIFLIVTILIVLAGFIITMFRYYDERIKLLLKRLDQSESEFNSKIRNKYNILIRMINIIENKYKTHSKIFDEIKKIKVDDMSSIKSEDLFNKCYKEIIDIKEDNKKVREVKTFKEVIDEYNENELQIISLRTFYNTYALEYNNVIKKIPYNIVSLFKKYKTRNILDGKEIETDFNNDLEV